MGDEIEGPYKVVSKLRRGGSVESYSIAKETRDGRTLHLKEVVPDAGEGQNARHICNLLNKNWREKRDEANGIDAVDGSGVHDPDLGDGNA